MKYLLFFLLIFISNSLYASDWQQIDDLDSGFVKSISCPDSNNTFVLAQYDEWIRLYKSIDHGETWVIIHQSEPLNEENPKLVNYEVGFSPIPNHYYLMATDYPIIKKSNDGGKTYSRIILDTLDADARRNIYRFTMLDTNIGIAISLNWIFVTNDGWISYNKYPALPYCIYYSPIFIDKYNVLMISLSYKDNFNNLLIKYNITNDTQTPLYQFKDNHSVYEIFMKSIFFINDTLGYCCGEENILLEKDIKYDLIYKTTDGGITWIKILEELVSPPFGLQEIAFHDEKNGVAVGKGGKILTTNDKGMSWILNDISQKINNPLTMKIVWSGKYPIIGTSSSGEGIFRYEGNFFDFTYDTTDVEEYIKSLFGNIEVNIRQSYYQFYISIIDEHYHKYKLQIYNSMGNVVMEQELSSGVGTLYVPYDISDLTNGAYLCMISMEGIVVKTGKLLVAKCI
jgi:photosystem II stability/assembly factor-like uncharacterized protein